MSVCGDLVERRGERSDAIDLDLEGTELRGVLG